MTDLRVDTDYAVEVAGLRVDLADGTNVVADIGFTLRPGEILGLIGESGSGKTTVASALLGHTWAGNRITDGSIVVGGIDVLALSPTALREARGRVISYVPQDPAGSLNPAMRIGAQLHETLAQHGVTDRAERAGRIATLLAEVTLPADEGFLRRYPHELSGGQQQRVVIAIGFLCRPRVVVLDEPTTGLDVTTQAHVLETVRALCRTHRTAAVYVSHDLAVVADLADRIAVLYYGRLVELGPTDEVVRHPGHPYSRALVEVIPDARQRRTLRPIRGRVAPLRDRPGGCVFADRCDVVEDTCREAPVAVAVLADDHLARCRRIDEVRSRPRVGEVLARTPSSDDDGPGHLAVRGLTAWYGDTRILHGVDIEVPRGRVTAVVGESGSGKTTLARSVGGLHEQAAGEVSLGGVALPFGARRRSVAQRGEVQYIFQNAGSALNPRKTVRQSLTEPLRTLGDGAGPGRVEELLDAVSLGRSHADRYPSQLSGGERQRVTIARALATNPSVLVCDEITSALDVSVQASILQLLGRLCVEQRVTLLFVTHNLAVVRAFADRVAVLAAGRIVEEGDVDRVLDEPTHAYTRDLLRDTPRLVEP